MQLKNLSKNTFLATDIEIANTHWTRMKGLLGRKDLPKGRGLLIKPCDSVHMFFMKFPIDVVFLDKKNNVVFLYHELQPWRLSGFHFNAACCAELPAGSIRESMTEKGDQLSLI